ncbi:MAG: long-chain fatty acid--CoA ligase, partial [Alphaproteobacteria bacterium]
MTVHDRIPTEVEVHGVRISADLSRPPFLIDGHDTIPKLWAARCREFGERTAHREKDYGIWLSYSWSDFWQAARKIGMALHALGLRRGDVVSILSEDNKEWLYIDMAVQAMGAIASGVYPTDSAQQLAYLVNDSGSRFLFVENEEQLDKFLTVQDEVPGLVKVIVLDPEGLHDFRHERVMMLDDLYRLGTEAAERAPELFEQEIAKGRHDDVAILVYTSGTTGPPKGAMISHANIFHSLSAGLIAAPTFRTDEQICFLPLCHILERLFSGFAPLVSGATVNFAESPETVFDNLREVSPHTFVAVPRVWEKIYSRVAILVKEATPLQQWAYRRAVNAGLRVARARLIDHREPTLAERLSLALWDRLVLANIRRMLGMDRIRRGGSGAAPIAPDLLLW